MSLLQISVVTLSKENEEPAGGTNLDTKFRLADDDSSICLDRCPEPEVNNSFINKVIVSRVMLYIACQYIYMLDPWAFVILSLKVIVEYSGFIKLE